jgi:putative transposase
MWDGRFVGFIFQYYKNLCLDKGYDYPEIERESIERRYMPHIRHRGVEKELIKIGYATKRWVVERTNS